MKDYMQMFIWIMLFVIVIEMVFPDSDYKKYLKLVLGCIIMYTIIQPIVRFIPLEAASYDSYVSEYQKRLTEGIGYEAASSDYHEQVNRQQELLKDTFAASMKGLIERELDVSVLSIDMTWSKGESQEIERIDLIVGQAEGELGKSIVVPKIKIADKSSSVSGDEEKLKIKIKTCLKNFYNVQTRNIYITVQKN